ncbi:DUF2252 domain-containing protein [Bacillus sp. BHET2]|uniref:DUF2252 family protein n=1 Tax=Bacillus sp. BHET2 TaxID=2583818 RepID=UPI00110E455D|nr:DUF2252 family protein [Bacillus sp. BHET2]TMU87069.1 DUF2252 domain-containing protein [Bacillus sp. BHET2]
MKRSALTCISMTVFLMTGPINGLAMTNSSTRTDHLEQEISDANRYISDSSVKMEKYQAMEDSSFAFYRATNFLYYQDLDNGTIGVPTEWTTTSNINTWLSGDFHTQNVGFFDNDEGDIVFDLNDFDDSYIGPFYWDLLRYTTSIYLLKDQLDWNLSQAEADELAMSFLTEYQDTLTNVNGNAGETEVKMDKATVTGFIDDEIYDVTGRDASHALNKWTVVNSSGDRQFDFSNTDLSTVDSYDLVDLEGHWSSYLQDISDKVSGWDSHYFDVKDRARRLHSGLGSLGVDKYYVLIEGPTSDTDDDQLVEVKEQLKPNMFVNSLTDASLYTNQLNGAADTARVAYKGLQDQVDDHMGVLTGESKSYLVRRMSPWKHGLDPVDFNTKSDLDSFVKYSAQALAYAHARADRDYQDEFISYNFEDGALQAINVWPQFKTKVVELAGCYADQVNADYQSFLQLRQDSRLP